MKGLFADSPSRASLLNHATFWIQTEAPGGGVSKLLLMLHRLIPNFFLPIILHQLLYSSTNKNHNFLLFYHVQKFYIILKFKSRNIYRHLNVFRKPCSVLYHIFLSPRLLTLFPVTTLISWLRVLRLFSQQAYHIFYKMTFQLLILFIKWNLLMIHSKNNKKLL